MSHNTETVGFEDISALIDVYRDELERGGYCHQASLLRGIEVLGRSGAEVALFTIRSLPKTSDDTDVMKRYIESSLVDLVSHAAA